MDSWKLCDLLFIDDILSLLFTLFFFFFILLDDISILTIDGWFHRSSCLKEQYIFSLFFDVFILINLQQLFLNIHHIIEFDFILKCLELLVELSHCKLIWLWMMNN